MLIDWNSGIRGLCEFCNAEGFVYHNAALGRDVIMCDPCRDDIERRRQYAAYRTGAPTRDDGIVLPTKQES